MMKRLIAMLMALALLASGALAEELPSWPGGVPLAVDGTPETIDLNGDGIEETVVCRMVEDDYDGHLQLLVTAADGTEAVFDTEILSMPIAWAADMNGDGLVEVFLSGDIMSDDYFTVCLNCIDGTLRPLLFADTSRGDNLSGAYFKQGYGLLEDADPAAGTVTLCGSQDVLGTWFGSRTLKLEPGGLFEYADDGWWKRQLGDDDDGELWEYAALTLKTSVPCHIDGVDAVLAPGDRILITGSDKESEASFLTQDGRTGTLVVFPDYEKGWGWQVDGISEDDLFEHVPYAD